MKRASKTKSTRYVRPRRGRIRMENGKVVRDEEEIGSESESADTAPTMDDLRQGRNTYNEQLSNDYNW